MSKWFKSDFPGIRYRKHSNRKHGVKLDRYFSIRYYINGKQKEEGLGWASQGWTLNKANATLAEIKNNIKTGEGARSLKEKRENKAEKEREKATQQQLALLENTTFNDCFNLFLEYSKNNKRSEISWKREEQLYNCHIAPILSPLTLSSIAQIHLEKIKSNMSKKSLAPRTVRYALDVIRQVFNYASRAGLFSGDNPAGKGKIKRPQEDNKRIRFLSQTEASILFKELKKHSLDTHDMAYIALYTGMRFSEIAKLKWIDIDFQNDLISIVNTKSNKNRHAELLPNLRKLLKSRNTGNINDLIFPARGSNEPKKRISRSYYLIVEKLFNEGIKDKKMRVTFHTLRHTFASWLVEKGTDIYIVQDLMGHSSIELTARYAHIRNEVKKSAVYKLLMS